MPPTLLVLVSLSPAFSTVISLSEGFQVAQRGKRLPAVQETQGSIPGSGRSPGEGNGYPLQYSSLVNPTDRGAWWATVHGVPESEMTKPHTHTHTHNTSLMYEGERAEFRKLALQGPADDSWLVRT